MKQQKNRNSIKDSVSKITNRISEKIRDYENYSFTSVQDCALKTFFDLAQEFESQHDLYCISVLIPKIFFGYECVIYISQPDGRLKTACHSEDIHNDPPLIKSDIPAFYKEPSVKGTSFYLSIRGNIAKSYEVPYGLKNGVFGIFEIRGAHDLSENLRFFFEKYVNRVGFQLHNRMISEKNREHLAFIKNLVNDIGHNVIVPNMYFKLFFRRMKGKIDRARDIGKELKLKSDILTGKYSTGTAYEIQRLCKELDYINGSMEEQFQQILTHYEQTSLFLETLLRRSHFEQGRYVLEAKPVNIDENIIKPQLNRYLPRLLERGIEIDNQVSSDPNRGIMVVADAGLISQAYANLFSNAVKYTREIADEKGIPEKYISLRMKILEDYFGDGKKGVKLNMFSTGVPLSDEDAEGLFQEGYRGRNTEEEYGTGHGLQFIKEVVEMHNGDVGYEPASNGNDFFFVLPA